MGLVDCIKSSEANVLGRDLAEEDLLIELRILAVPGECGDDNSVPAAMVASNGFFNARGVSGFIPNAYSLLEQHTWQRLNRAWERDNCSSSSHVLLEYDRPGWQFHCKGIWWASTLILS